MGLSSPTDLKSTGNRNPNSKSFVGLLALGVKVDEQGGNIVSPTDITPAPELSRKIALEMTGRVSILTLCWGCNVTALKLGAWTCWPLPRTYAGCI
jgi:hypothetical protein